MNRTGRPHAPRWLCRWLAFGGILTAVVITVAFLLPLAASAQSFIDPAGAVRTASQSNNWLGLAQQWAQRIYLTLLVFELIALAITALLFRDNLGEFIAGITLKIVLGGVYFWFIANSGVAGFPGQVVATFTTFGQQLGGNTDVVALAAKAGTGAALYFTGAELAKTADDARGAALDIPPNCTFALGTGDCTIEEFLAAMTSHVVYEFMLDGMGVMILMAVAAIYLQFVLITIESYIVMTAGTLFIGFAASRFTLPFSQGYFSYMMNVGVKLMVMYIILGIEDPLINNILISSIAAFAAAAADPTGTVGDVAGLVAGLFGLGSVLIGAALVWTIPGFAASFLTGQSSVSGAAVLQQSLSSFAGSAQMMMRQMANSSMQTQNIAKARQNLSSIGSPPSGPSNETMAPASVPGGGAQSFERNAAEENPAAGAVSPGLASATALGNDMAGALQASNRPAVRRSATASSAVPSVAETRSLGGNSEPPSYHTNDSVPIYRSDDSRLVSFESLATREDARPAFSDRPDVPLESEESVGRPALDENLSAPPARDENVSAPPARDENVDAPPARDENVNAPPARDENVNAPSAPILDVPRRRRSGAGLNGMSPNEIRGLSGSDGARLARETDFEKLDREQLASLRENGELAEAIRAVYVNDIENEMRSSAALSAAYGRGQVMQKLYGLAQAAPHDIGQPTAVEVRISNPDRL